MKLCAFLIFPPLNVFRVVGTVAGVGMYVPAGVTFGYSAFWPRRELTYVYDFRINSDYFSVHNMADISEMECVCFAIRTESSNTI